jgi:hypothetical protein
MLSITVLRILERFAYQHVPKNVIQPFEDQYLRRQLGILMNISVDWDIGVRIWWVRIIACPTRVGRIKAISVGMLLFIVIRKKRSLFFSRPGSSICPGETSWKPRLLPH